jgi:hypothetical protein
MADNVAVSPDGQSSTYSDGASGTAPSAVELVDRAVERMSEELDPFGAAAPQDKPCCHSCCLTSWTR